VRIKEVCSCGGSIDVENSNSLSVHDAIKNWREEHKHQPRSPYWQSGSIGYQGGAAIINCGTEGVDYVLNGEGERVRI
jgi:hypothetical protein